MCVGLAPSCHVDDVANSTTRSPTRQPTHITRRFETDTHWFTHGFSADLHGAMTMAAEQMLWLMCEHLGLSRDDAYSPASVAMDLGVTQVVDASLGCHASIARNIVS